MPDTAKHFKVDWKKLDLGDLITIGTVIVAVVLAYGDIKKDQAADRAKVEAKFEAYDKVFEAQKVIDKEQNERMIRIYSELQAAIKELKADIRSDLKDIKTDMAIRSANGRVVR